MATATAHHYATVNPYTGEVVREFDSLDAAARTLGISRKGLYLKRLRYGLIEPGEEAEEAEVAS